MHHLARVLGRGRTRVLVHQPREQILVEASPIHSDAHRLAVPRGDLDDLGELLVALLLEADIAGIDAIFGESFGAGRILGEQRVAVIVEVADERRVDAQDIEPLADMRHGGSGLGAIDGDAHELGARAGERRDLLRRRLDVGACRYWSSTARRSGHCRRS